MNQELMISEILRKSIFSFCLILTTGSLSGQNIYVTKSGQTIQLNSNGLWTFIEQVETDENGLVVESELAVDPYELPSSSYNVSSSEEAIYKHLKEQLQFFEADYFVRHMIIKERIETTDADKTDKQLEKDLRKRYETSYLLLEKLAKFHSSDKKKRDDIINEVRESLAKEFKVVTEDLQLYDHQVSTLREEVQLESFELDDRHAFDIVKEHNCNVIFNGYDPEIQKSRKEIKRDKWFNYTHPKLLNHFGSKDFLTGEASLMKISDKTYLNLRLILATRDARRSYGFIEDEAMLRISLINGDKIYLKNQIRSNGELEAYTGNTIYQCLYLIDKDYVNEIKRTEVDKVGVMWSTGFEEYEVYHVDFLINQLECLKNE